MSYKYPGDSIPGDTIPVGTTPGDTMPGDAKPGDTYQPLLCIPPPLQTNKFWRKVSKLCQTSFQVEILHCEMIILVVYY